MFQPAVDAEVATVLSQQLKVDLFVAELLVQRGLRTEIEARRFFRPSLDELHDPFLMKDMEAAVNRINEAIKNQEGILLFGDYDVDGTTQLRSCTSN